MPLVVGADSFLGRRLTRALAARHGPGVMTAVITPGHGDASHIDPRSGDALAALRERARDETVYYCADSAEGEGGREWAHRVDVALPRALAGVAGQLVYISTDRVFGQGGQVHSDTEPQPGSRYGALKLEGERAVLSTASQALVARVSSPFDDEGTPARSFAGLRGTEAADDRAAAPSYAPDVIRRLLGAVRAEARGTLHLTGPAQLSDYDFHQLASLRWGFDVAPTVAREAEPSPAPVPSPGVRLRAPADVFLPRRPRRERAHQAKAQLTVFDCVGVVLGRRMWKEVGKGFWESQGAWGLRTGPLPEAASVADAYGPNPYFWRALRAMPPHHPRVLANNGPLASFGIWEQRYGFAEMFDLVINSEREGFSKPSPAFFERVAGLAARGTVTLVDDTEDIVSAARRHGWGGALSSRVSAWPVEEYRWRLPAPGGSEVASHV